ncbi:MAG: hypothetical protein KC912_22390 [Proteobacteria bacterium]|nr:hypothetical protein [Pseudomonadota bacterium]
MLALLMSLALAAPVHQLDEVFTGARAEVPLERGTWLVPMAVAEPDGVVLLKGGAEVAEITWYDAALEPVDATLLELPRSAQLVDWHRDGDALFLLFDARGPREVLVVEVPVRPGRVGLQLFDGGGRVVPRQIVVDGTDVYVRALTPSSSVILLGEAGGGASMRTVGDPDLPRRLGFQRMVASGAGGIDVVVHDARRRRRTSWLMHAESGLLERLESVSPQEDEPNLISAQWVEQPGGRLVIGTYAAGARSLGAQGLYVARFGDQGREWLKTTSFTEMPGFFSYLSDRGQERFERKAERKRASGQELRVGYQLITHDLIEHPQGVLLVGEAIEPVYRTETVTETVTVNGRMQTRTVTRRVFAGWQHTHAFATLISEQGELTWTHSFEMGEQLYPTVSERVAVGVDDQGVTLRFASGARLISKRIADGDVVQEREEERIVDEDVLRAWATGAAPWGDAFLLWGRERVAGEQGRRKVFFLARVED